MTEQLVRSEGRAVNQSPAAIESSVAEVAQKNLSDNPFIFVPEDRSRADVELAFALEDSEGHEYTSDLSMRRPLVNDSIIAEKQAKGDRNQLFVIRLGNLCEVPPEVMSSIDELEDMETLVEGYQLLSHYGGKAAGNPMIKLSEDGRTAHIRLYYPVEPVGRGAETAEMIAELKMRRPKLEDATEAEEKSEWPTEVLAHKYAALCNVDVEVIKQLDDIDDFASLDQAFGFFRRAKVNRRKQR